MKTSGHLYYLLFIVSWNTTYYFLQSYLRCHIIFFPRSWQKNRRDRFLAFLSITILYFSLIEYYLLIKFHSHWCLSSLQLLHATGPLHILPEIVPLPSTHGCYFFTFWQYDFTAVLLSSVYRCNNDGKIFHTPFYLDHLIWTKGEIITMLLSRRAIWPQVTPPEPKNLCTEKWMWTWDSWYMALLFLSGHRFMCGSWCLIS